MCNACGFYCCASDMFSGCGCDHCDNIECWPDEDDDDYYNPDDYDIDAASRRRPRLRCEAVNGEMPA